MQINTFKTIILSFFLSISFMVKAVNDETKEQEKFNTNELIFHHITDSHGFHVFGDVSIPLPVILFTDNGLVAFMSSEFHHDVNGEVIVEKGGQRFINLQEEIYSLNDGATSVQFDAEHHPENASKPYDFSITKNVFSMFLSLLLMLGLFLTAAASYKKSENNVPTGVGKFLEPIIVFIRDDVAIPNIGHNYRKYMPFLLTLFFFIWLNNIFGIIPFFPFSSNLSGNIAFTMALAVVVFIVTLFSSKKSYWKHMLWMPGVPVPMKLFLAPIEFLGMFVKPIALMIRLFANITAGHVIILSLISLIFVLETIWVAPVSVIFVVFISVIEVLVVAIQAYIFTLLSALYIGQAMEDEH
ncbi:ATP synthase F0 subcomplex A subunit [Flavobacteriaceae bacterium MAR_2010_188]|nr:ATP synthase F0 subcomplex A subunit [Flavobacteriaceae bacterium MAR_2010_188]